MAKKHNGRGYLPPVYRSYMFKDRDPAIDELRTMIEDHFGDRVNGKSLRQINEDGGPSTTCMVNWFFGATKRPQNATLEAAGRAMGYERVWRKQTTKRGAK